jgi:ankyrin repeat protein
VHYRSQFVAVVNNHIYRSDKKVLRQQHQFFAEARWGSLKKFQSHKLDPLTTKDPLGNTVAHLAVHNPHLEVFPHIATKYPALLTTQNIFGNTPLHNLALLRSRQLNAEYFEWKYIWSLPWNFSLKNKKGQTAVEKLCEIGGKDLMQAFQALFDNKEAWQSVTKCHEVSKLLSVVLTKYFADGATNSPEEDVLRTAKLFVEQGKFTLHVNTKLTVDLNLRTLIR